MAIDPVAALMSTAQATPDPRIISNWLTAYLGTRPLVAKQSALSSLERQFDEKLKTGADQRAAGMILRVIHKLQENLK